MNVGGWERIQDGPTFESLVQSLVRCVDPKAIIFGRKGRDAGQDARSGDGTIVYQAKYHAKMSVSSAISDARKELIKIKRYRRAEDERHLLWKGVKTWCLVTNCLFNTSDEQKWNTEVVPAFREAGLEAIYWLQSTLDQHLIAYPDVRRFYFNGEVRNFLNLAEAFDREEDAQPFASDCVKLRGRDREMAEARKFAASDELFLLIAGQGGVGKTRLLLEIGEDLATNHGWQVLWCNNESMVQSSDWFASIPLSQPVLLLLDEPQDASLLKVLAEQLGRKFSLSKWKVAVSVRSWNAQVLQFFRGPRLAHRIRRLNLSELSQNDSTQLVTELLSGTQGGGLTEGEIQRTAESLVSTTYGHFPIWLTLAVHLLKQGLRLSHLPERAAVLASMYVKELTEKSISDTATVLSVLQWISLLGVVNSQNQQTMSILSKECFIDDLDDLRAFLSKLADEGGVSRRGYQRRLFEVRPDVIRDHILREWLAAEIDDISRKVVPSGAAKRLLSALGSALEEGPLNANGKAILGAVARTEAVLSVSEDARVDLLGVFFELIDKIATDSSLAVRLSALDALVGVAHLRPQRSVENSALNRMQPGLQVTVQTLLGPREINHDELVLELPWIIFHAAHGASTEDERVVVLHEMCELVKTDSDIMARRPGSYNDGKRAGELLGRLLEGEGNLGDTFSSSAFAAFTRLIDDVSTREPTTAEATILKVLSAHSLSAERRHTEFSGYQVNFSRYVIYPSASEWLLREKVLKIVKQKIQGGLVPLLTRLMLWQIFASAHQNLIQARMADSCEARSTFSDALRNDLDWTCVVVKSQPLSIEELREARKVWDWHAQFDEQADLKQIAEELEGVYHSNGLAAEFEPLLQSERKSSVELAGRLGNSDAPALHDFISRARAYLGTNGEIARLGQVASALGDMAGARSSVRRFVGEALAMSDVPPDLFNFVGVLIGRWVETERASRPASTPKLVKSLLSKCVSTSAKQGLMAVLYAPQFRRNAEPLLKQELDLVSEALALFQETENERLYAAVASALIVEKPEEYKRLIKTLLEEASGERVVKIVEAVISALEWQLERLPASRAFGEWVLQAVASVDDLSTLHGNAAWELGRILERCGQPDVVWLADIARVRAAREGIAQGQGVQAVSDQFRLSKYVEPVNEFSAKDSATINAVGELIDMEELGGTTRFYLPRTLMDVDPQGLLVPRLIASRIERTAELEEIMALARLARSLRVGSEAWNDVARVAIKALDGQPDAVLVRLFSTLKYNSVRTFSRGLGQVPPLFEESLARARAIFEETIDYYLKKYWAWEIKVAESDLEQAKAEAQEERGE